MDYMTCTCCHGIVEINNTGVCLGCHGATGAGVLIDYFNEKKAELELQLKEHDKVEPKKNNRRGRK